MPYAKNSFRSRVPSVQAAFLGPFPRRIFPYLSIAAGMPYNIATMYIKELREAGVVRVRLPSVAVFSAIQAARNTLFMIYCSEDFNEVMAQNLLCSMDDVAEIVAR